MTRIRLLSLAAAAMLGTGLVAGCGGGGGGDEDPQQVLDETFNNDETVTSGVLDLSVSGSAEGDQGGNIDASLNGPFQSEEGKFPELDLTATVSGEGGGQSIDFTGGLITTTDAGFVSYQDTTYEVPKPFFQQLQQATEQAQAQAGGQNQDAGAVFDQLGIDPSGWLTNLENEGDEDVEGTETIHIHGDANVPQILEDLQSAAEQTGTGTGQLTPDQLSQVEEAVTDASIDVYSGKEDRILRRLDLNLGLEAPPEAAASGVETVDVEFSLTLSDVNQPQTIEAPSGAQPFSQLEQDLGLPPGLLEGALGGEGLTPSLGGGSLGGGGGGGLSQKDIGRQFGVPGGGDGGTGGGGTGGGGGSGAAYAKCLQQATTPEQIQACVNQL